MQKLVFENSNGVTVDLTDFEKYGITDWSGLSECSMDIQSQQVPFNDGSVFLDALLQDRTLSFTVAVNDGGDLQKRYELKRELISILNPKLGEGYLYYTNDYLSRKIKCIPEVPTFPTKNMDNAGTLKASISFTACNPYWEDLKEKSEILSSMKIIEVENKGDVKTNVNLELYTTGIESLELKNLTTKQKIQLSNLNSPIVFVDTNLGNKSVYAGKIKNIVLQNQTGDLTNVKYFSDVNKYILCLGTNIAISEDAETWEIIPLSDKGKAYYTDYYNYDVIYANKKFIVIGNRQVSVSSDLYNWTSYELPEELIENDVNVDNILFAKNKFYFYANVTIVEGSQEVTYRYIYSSSDLQTWERISVDNLISSNIKGLIYNEEVFSLITTNGEILISEDAETWGLHNDFIGRTIYYYNYDEGIEKYIILDNNKKILLIDSILDLTNYSEYTAPYISYYTSIQFVKELNKYYLLTSDKISYSEDLENWINVEVGEDNLKIIYNSRNGEFLLVGHSNSRTILKGFNVTSLMEVYPIGFPVKPYKVYNFNDNLYVYTQSNYENSVRHLIKDYQISKTENANLPIANKIIYSKNKNIYITYIDNIIYSSNDGLNFNPVFEMYQDFTVSQIAYLEEKEEFCIMGKYNNKLSLYRSSNGSSWDFTEIETQINYLSINTIDYYNNIYVISGRNNQSKIFVLKSSVYDFSDYNVFYTEGAYSYNVKGVFNISSDESILYLVTGNAKVVKFANNEFSEIFTDIDVDIDIRDIAYDSTSGNVYACTLDGQILRTANFENWEITSFQMQFHTMAFLKNGTGLIMNINGYDVIFIEFDKTENIINKLSSVSDMNFYLETGVNKLLITNVANNMNSKITFNEKYIGV